MDSYSVKEMIEEFRAENNRRFDKVDAAQAHTNGDVSILKMWRGYITGAVSVIIVIVIPLLVYVWNQAQKQRSKLEALSNYQQLYEITTNDKNH